MCDAKPDKQIRVFIEVIGNCGDSDKRLSLSFTLPLKSLRDIDELYDYIMSGVQAYEDDNPQTDDEFVNLS